MRVISEIAERSRTECCYKLGPLGHARIFWEFATKAICQPYHINACSVVTTDQWCPTDNISGMRLNMHWLYKYRSSAFPFPFLHFTCFLLKPLSVCNLPLIYPIFIIFPRCFYLNSPSPRLHRFLRILFSSASLSFPFLSTFSSPLLFPISFLFPC